MPAAGHPADRATRLIRLDESHYFDPVLKVVLVASAGGLDTPGQSSERAGRAAGMVRQEARWEGYEAVQEGLFWNAGEQRLYEKGRGRDLLVALDRRADADPS
ncbi:MAG TPA: hypothetical protein VNZ67_09380 [bacterium]|nr:hypothetical protein [bacterium]